MDNICFRQMISDDMPTLYAQASEFSLRPEVGYFEQCLEEQDEGARHVFVAEYDGTLAGYAQIIWKPAYQPFRSLEIPEIQDVNVARPYRRQGIGEALVAHCEQAVKDAGKTDIGIGVGLTRDYGAAQRLYIRRGYMPDGAGVVYENQPVMVGEMRPVNGYLCLKLIKELG